MSEVCVLWLSLFERHSLSLRPVFAPRFCILALHFCVCALRLCVFPPVFRVFAQLIAPHFRVCALRLCVFRPIVCVFAQPSMCHCAAFLCVRAPSLSVSAQFLWVSTALCVFPLFTLRFFSTLALLSSQWLCLCVCARSCLWFLLLLRSNVVLKIITSKIGVWPSGLLQLFSRKSSLSA